MCRECLIEFRPDRGRTCLDDGVYALNFKACKQCGKRSRPKESKRIEENEEEDEESNGDIDETVTFHHVCPECDHVICEHYYNYKYTKTTHTNEYMMECPLCGKGADTTQHVPKDERLEDQKRVVDVPDWYEDEEVQIVEKLSVTLKLDVTAKEEEVDPEDDWED